MVVLLYSDTNYVLEGFSAEYSVTDCPFNCSGHGHCMNHTCVCEVAFIGEACEFEACPNQCGFTESRGLCEKIDGLYRCMCNSGFLGLDCSLDTRSSAGNAWHLLGRASPSIQRTAHSGVYLKSLDRFYAFGGFDLNVPLGDLLAFDLATSRWANLSSVLPLSVPSNSSSNSSENSNGTAETIGDSTVPLPRYGHAQAAIQGDGFVLNGGQLSNGSLSDEFFFYDAPSNKWTLLASGSKIKPPPLTRHAMTVVNQTWVYLFGGGLSNGEFSSRLFRVNINSSGSPSFFCFEST